MSLLLTNILNNVSKSKKEGSIYPAERKLDYYSSRATIQKRQATITPTLDEILEHGLLDLEQLMQIYSLINYKIEVVKYEPDDERNKQNGTTLIYKNNQAQCNSYLSLKSHIFHKIYLPESSLNEPTQLSINGFRVARLLKLYQWLVQIEKTISSELKIDMHCILLIESNYLLAQICQLIKQVKTAAFPFQEKQFSAIQVQEKIQLSDEHKQMLLDELKLLNAFGLYRNDYLQTALGYLNHEINKLSIKIQNALPVQSIEYRVSKRTFDDLEGYTLIIRKDQIVCMKIKFEMAKFINQKFSLQEKNLSEIITIYNQDPLSRLDKKQLEKIKQGLQDYPIECSMYAIFLYQVINTLKKKHYIFSENQNYPNLLIKLITTAENCLILSSQKSLLVFENYIKLLNLYSKIDKNYTSSRQNEIYKYLQRYVKLLTENLSEQKQNIKEELMMADETFTYNLLVSDKIIQNMQKQKNEIMQIIDKAVPLLQIISAVNSLQVSRFKNKTQFIQQILLRVNFTSLLNQESIQILTRVGRGKKDDNLQRIIGLNKQLLKQIPHLKQLKNIIILIEILSNSSQGKNRHETQEINIKHLSQISKYFATKRQCNIYNLKSKIMFFIALFKMGYYIPKYREDGDFIDLRPRILNLFTNLSRQNNPHLYVSRIQEGTFSIGNIGSSIYPDNDDNNFDYNENLSDNQTNISASPQLMTNIRGVIEEGYIKSDSNWKQYIANRLNILQHQLFIQQRNKQKRQQEYLVGKYLQHIRNCIKCFDEKQFKSDRFQTLINIQKYFYLQKYEQGWELLIKQKKSNAQFSSLIDKLFASTNKSMELFKFQKIYKSFATYFEYINPNFYSKEDLKDKDIEKIIKFINKETMLQIERQPIVALYQYCLKNQNMQIQQSLNKEKDKINIQPINSLQQPVPIDKKLPEPSLFFSIDSPSFFPSIILQEVHIQAQNDIDHHGLGQQVRVLKRKDTIIIEIPNEFERAFTLIKQKLSPFIGKEKQRIGICKIIDIKTKSGKIWKQQMIIELQENPFFGVNLQQKLVQNLLKKIIEVNTDYLKDEINIDLTSFKSGLNVNFQNLSFCINPFYVLIENILDQAERKTKPKYHFKQQIQTIQQLIQPIKNKFSRLFCQNYDYFILKFYNSTRAEIQDLKHLPIFKDKDGTISLLLKSQEKVAKLYKQFHNKFRQSAAKFANNVGYIQNCKRLLKISDYKNYCYHFGTESILQLQIKELYKVELNLPNVLSDLKRSIAKNNSEDIIKQINKEYPILLTCIDRKSHLFNLTYEQIIKNKIDFLKHIFGSKNLINQLRKMPGNPLYAHSFQVTVIALLAKYKKRWNQINELLQKSLSKYNCFQCKKMKQLLKKPIIDLFDFLQRFSSSQYFNNVNENYFVSEHTINDCFLRTEFRGHSMIQEVRNKLKIPSEIVEPKYYIVVSWWFFLETNFPNLLDILQNFAQEFNNNERPLSQEVNSTEFLQYGQDQL